MRTQRKTRLSRLGAGVGALALVCGVLFSGQFSAPPAQAALEDLPTWDEVQAAKADSAAAAAKVAEIQNLLAQGQQELERLRTSHADAIAAAQQAEADFMAAAQKSDTLDAQAEQSRIDADAAAEQAAGLVSQMYRSGGVDRGLQLFFEADGDTADQLLDRLASMSKATERNTTVSQEAEQAMNTAASLGEQAELARQEREALRIEKERLAQEAAEAVASQADQVAAQEEQQKVLEAQLAALQDTEATTVAGYQERLRQEEAIRQEQIRQAEEAARRAREEAAANNPGGGGGGGGGGSSSGWLVPIPYSYISTYFNVASAFGTWHSGVDLVNGCGVPIVAPNSGTISFVGYHDNMGGNMIYLNHGGGYQTRYAHLSGFNVNYGQWVNQGQVIGYVGTTGASLGCHLHYEVLLNGVFIDPYGNGFV